MRALPTSYHLPSTSFIKSLVLALVLASALFASSNAVHSQSTELIITDIAESSITTTSATITWRTSIVASGSVKYGLTSSAAGGEAVDSGPDSTSHSVTLSGLSGGTTYYYKVTSSGGGQTVESRTARTFTTATSTSSGGPPTIVFGPRADATSDHAIVTFRTDAPTAAMIEYDTNPNTSPIKDPVPSPGYTFKCDGSMCPPEPGNPAQEYATNHAIVLTGFQPSQTYRYKITVVDSAGRSFITSDFQLQTSASGDDHVFSTGKCNDDTAIRACNAEGKYCRPGGGDPVYDCRPDIPCPTLCPSGSTCQETGDCTLDTALSNSQTQCNPKTCYLKCDPNSGSKTGKRCSQDSDCEGGRCVQGSFTNPAAPGCYSSWPQCSANTILKVRPDRACDKWLSCKTSFAVKDSQGKTENQCTDLTICDSLSSSGQCNNLLEGRQCSNDPLRFCTKDTDCIGPGATCLPAGSPKTLTFRTPEDVSQIKNLTGYAYAGLDWHGIKDSPKIEGYYPLSVAPQVGKKMVIPDSDFEDVEIVQRCSLDSSTSCSLAADPDICKAPGKGKCIVQRTSNELVKKYWEAVGASADIFLDKDPSRDNPNQMLKITPSDQSGSGAQTKASSVSITTSANTQYMLNVRMRSQQNDQPIQISLINRSNQAKNFNLVKLSTGWQPYLLGPIFGPGGETRLTFKSTVNGDPISFWIDDVQLLPALKVNDITYLPQSCRLYPNDGAPKCDYVDEHGLTYEGLKGYCLERDPRNSSVCLSWWPVDVTSGNNIYGKDTESGFAGRTPLYYCAESQGLQRVSINGAGGASTTNPGYLYGEQIIGIGDNVFTRNPAVKAVNPGQPTYHLPSSAIKAVRIIRTFGNPCVQWPSEISFTASEFERSATKVVPSQGEVGCAATINNNYKASIDQSNPNALSWIVDETDCTEGGNPGGGSGGIDGHNCIYAKFNFDSNRELVSYQYDGADKEGTETNLAAYQIVFEVKEQCNKLVKVVDESGNNAAWLDRTSSTSTYVVPDLNYRYVSDLRPFAGAATPEREPSDWNESLGIEGPAEISQVRGGGSYACDGPCTTRVCSSGKVGEKCYTKEQCDDNSDPGNPISGVCAGNGVCLAYDSISQQYLIASSSKEPCTSTCSNPGEDCVGGNASNKGFQRIANFRDGPFSVFPDFYAQYHLMRLFARSYFGVWEWTNGKYRKNNDFHWEPPTRLCSVCNSGVLGGQACTIDESCSGATCVATDVHPEKNADSRDTTADYCAIKPSIFNIKDIDKVSIAIDEGNNYILTFNSKVDPEQRPLKAVRIDWGDGKQTYDEDLRIAPHDDPANPHVYYHAYHCDRGVCAYPPITIQIEDNWGWCDNGNNTNKCNSDLTTFTKGPKIVVKG